MSNIEFPEEDEEQENVVPLKLLTGGRDSGQNWLATLERDTVFLTRQKAYKSYEVVEHEVHNICGKAVLLKANVFQGEAYIWVDSFRFSQQWELVEIVR